MNRSDLGLRISTRLEQEASRLSSEFNRAGRIQSCYIDNLLPEETVCEIHSSFPKPESMMLKKSLREFKYVAAQMDQYNPLLEEVVYAFQDERVVHAVAHITGISGMIADHNLYAGGISLMSR